MRPLSAYTPKRISVRPCRSHSSNDTNVVVNAFLVGGESGVFAAWKDDAGIIHFAAGDDENWWEIGSYHPRWCGEIISAIQLAADSK